MVGKEEVRKPLWPILLLGAVAYVVVIFLMTVILFVANSLLGPQAGLEMWIIIGVLWYAMDMIVKLLIFNKICKRLGI